VQGKGKIMEKLIHNIEVNAKHIGELIDLINKLTQAVTALRKRIEVLERGAK
jgi:hypothetical protein